MYTVNLPHPMLKDYLNELMKNNLLQCRDQKKNVCINKKRS